MRFLQAFWSEKNEREKYKRKSLKHIFNTAIDQVQASLETAQTGLNQQYRTAPQQDIGASLSQCPFSRNCCKIGSASCLYSLGVILLEIAIWDNFANPDSRVGKTLNAAPDMFVPLMEELKNVPRLLGDKYRDATMSCLKMLEDETGEAVRDEDGVLLGTNYICQVLDKLEAIVL